MKGAVVGALGVLVWLLIAAVMFFVELLLRGAVLAALVVVAYCVLTVAGIVPPIDLPLIP